jgi:primosomal protein DnaI
MEKLSLSLSEKINMELDKELAISMQDKEFADLVRRVKIDKITARKNNSKLIDTVSELKNCKECPSLLNCKNRLSGYVVYPSLKEGGLKFIYMPCKYQREEEKKKIEKNNYLNKLASARMKDIDVTDKNRIKVIKWLKEYYDKYEHINTLKGLYLHGSFGSGKTYLIAALLNELSLKKNASCEIVYLPELLRNMKEDFSSVESKINYLQNADILLIDDIGAENVTAWGRDEILGTILQYRMNNKLTTFFTSNLTIEELERHLSITKDSEDSVKSRRIIERIKELTDDLELVSVNRRK